MNPREITFVVLFVVFALVTVGLVVAYVTRDIGANNRFDELNEKYGVFLHPSERDVKFEIFKRNEDAIKEEFTEKANAMGFTVDLNAFYAVDWELNDNFWNSHFDRPDSLVETDVEIHTVDPQRLTHKHSTGHTYQPSLDWRDSDAVTPVKNQWNCGSCYAFAAVGSIESAISIQLGQNINLSEQQIVNCAGHNLDCTGGNTAVALEHTIKSGISMSTAVPYIAQVQPCDPSTSVRINVKKYRSIKPNTESSDMLDALQIGPITAVMDARDRLLQFYSGGVYDRESWSSPTHAVLIVGYGTDNNGVDYWIVKNSWGDHWGIGGYMHIRRGTNCCNIASRCYYPVL